MTDFKPPKQPQLGVGAVVLKGAHVLMIKRGKPPRMGDWSLPGGRLELGETVQSAVLREVYEETGLTVKLGPLLDVIDYIEPGQNGLPRFHYVLVDFLAFHVDGEPLAATDAMDAKFFPVSDVLKMPLWHETLRVIEKALTLSRSMYETNI